MAEIQAESNNRLLPLPLMPAWDIDLCVARGRAGGRARGARREHDLRPPGPRRARPRQPRVGPVLGGVQRAAAPGALPHRRQRHRHDVLREVPVAVAPENTKLAIGGTLLFIGNARVVTNLILSGMFDRHPDLQDGVGRERRRLDPVHPRDARLRDGGERAATSSPQLKKMPSEYFRSNLYATFWFENNRNKLPDLIEAVGEDNILFETDFPHPTCLYPNPLAGVEAKMATLSPEARAQDPRRERPQALPALSEGANRMDTIAHWIGGPARRGHIGARRRPCTTPRAACRPREVALASAAEVADAVKVAVDASVEWGASPMSRRVEVMFRLRELVHAHRDDLAADRHPRARQGARRRARRGRPRPGVRRVRLRHPAPAEGRAQLRGLDRRRRPHRPAAGRRRRGHHAVQLPRHGPVVDAGQRRSRAGTPSC